jgi:hypothetical protein
MDSSTCVCCNRKYRIEWYNYYDLCDYCFIQFDNQKMNGRFGGEDWRRMIFYTENVNEFLNKKICTHQSLGHIDPPQGPIVFLRLPRGSTGPQEPQGQSQ